MRQAFDRFWIAIESGCGERSEAVRCCVCRGLCWTVVVGKW